MLDAESLWYEGIRMPLQAAPVLLVVTFSLLLWLASGAGLLGLPLGLIIASWFFKYAFVLLDACVAGRKEAPVLALEMVNPASEQRPLAMLMWVVAVYFASDASEYWFGPVVGWLLAAACAAVLPAMLAIQAVTGRVIDSINPRTVSRFIGRLGADYVRLLVAAIALLLVGDTAVSLDQVPLPVRLAVPMFAWLTLFALIGCMVNARAEVLGVEDASEPATDEEEAEAQAERRYIEERERFLDRIYAEWRGGSFKVAQQSVDVFLHESPDPTAALQWMYERAGRWPDHRLAESLAQRLLTRLLDAGSTSAALRIIRERVRVNATFKPSTAKELLTLARLARDGGDRPVARTLLVDFDRCFPNDALRTAAQALAAQMER